MVSKVEGQLEDYKKRERRRVDRVKGKVWRDHKRFVQMRREVDRLHEKVKELRFKWRNGPWPNKGKPGRPGVAGPSGTNGAPGLPGRMGADVVVKQIVRPTQRQVQHLIEGDVNADVRKDVAMELTQRLESQVSVGKRLMSSFSPPDSVLDVTIAMD